MGLGPDAVKRFDQQSDTIFSPDYNDTLIRELGWGISVDPHRIRR
jgi:hypothetical protein